MPIYKNPWLKQMENQIVDTIGWSDMKNAYLPKAVDREHRALLVFQYIVGARPIELARITRDKIEVERRRLKVRVKGAKGGKERLIYIPIVDEPTSFLKEYVLNKLPKQYIFPTLALMKNPRDYFRGLNEKARIGVLHNGRFYPFSFYVFRHNIATLLMLYGADIIDVILYQGKNPRQFMGSAGTYIHASAQHAERIEKVVRKILRST